MGDVEVGVEAQLAEPTADTRDAVEHLLAQQLERRFDLAAGLEIDWVRVRVVTVAGRVARLWRLPVAGWRWVDRAALRVCVGHDGGKVPHKVADAGVRCGAHEVDGEPVQQLEAGALLGGVVGREQRSPAHAETLDEPPDEDVGRDRAELGGGSAVQLDETLDPFARLGRHLRRLGGECESDDEVELARAPTVRRRATWMTRASSTWRSSIGGLDRARTTAAASCGSHQQSHPREHVAHLGALQEPALQAVGRRERDPGTGHDRRIRGRGSGAWLR